MATGSEVLLTKQQDCDLSSRDLWVRLRELEIYRSRLRPRLLQTVLRQTPDRAHTIFPADLLSFRVGAPRIADSNLIHAQAPPCDFDGDLRFKANDFPRDE